MKGARVELDVEILEPFHVRPKLLLGRRRSERGWRCSKVALLQLRADIRFGKKRTSLTKIHRCPLLLQQRTNGARSDCYDHSRPCALVSTRSHEAPSLSAGAAVASL
jgi:hypothetical protein